MHAMAAGNLALTERLESHLALCLTCRNCETVCPAKVNYGRLIDYGRALIEARRTRPLTQRLIREIAMDKLMARPQRLRKLASVMRFYQRSGLQWSLRKTRLLALLGLSQWDAKLPPLPAQTRWRSVYPGRAPKRGDVGLFIGCVTSIADGQTLMAAIRVLNALGYDVHIPPHQTCCGALHQHSGELTKATALMQQNIAAFDTGRLDAIISIASGCGAMLLEYNDYLQDDSRAQVFASKTQDISHFLDDREWPKEVSLAPLAARIAVHDPCTLKNVLPKVRAPYHLLEKIPAVQLCALPENNLCCGAAGTYFLTQTKMAEELRASKLETLKQIVPEVLVTSNIGCALHLVNGIRKIDLNVEVLHPVVLIERQLRVGTGKYDEET
jgi:glycolate oxidase iron-sulfur subunit